MSSNNDDELGDEIKKLISLLKDNHQHAHADRLNVMITSMKAVEDLLNCEGDILESSYSIDQDIFREENGISLLSSFLSTISASTNEGEAVITRIISLYRILARNPTNKIIMCEGDDGGILPLIIPLLSHPNQEICKHSVGIILNLAANEDNQDTIRRQGGLLPLLLLCSDLTRNEEIRHQALSTMFVLTSENLLNQHALLMFVSSPSDSSSTTATSSSLLATSLVQWLSPTSEISTPTSQELALSLLNDLFDSESGLLSDEERLGEGETDREYVHTFITTFLTAGGITVLIDLLSSLSSSSGTQVSIIFMLDKCISHRVFRQAMLPNRESPNIYRILAQYIEESSSLSLIGEHSEGSGSSPIRLYVSIFVLHLLREIERDREAIRENDSEGEIVNPMIDIIAMLTQGTNVIHVLILLLLRMDESDRIKSTALGLLDFMTRPSCDPNGEGRKKMCTMGGVIALLSVLNDPVTSEESEDEESRPKNHELKKLSLIVLQNIVSDIIGKDCIRNIGGLAILLSKIDEIECDTNNIADDYVFLCILLDTLQLIVNDHDINRCSVNDMDGIAIVQDLLDRCEVVEVRDSALKLLSVLSSGSNL